MAVISVKSFGGISPRTSARYLQEGQAQTALNSSVFNGSIQPLLGLSDTLLTLTKNGTVRTIYRFGQNEDSDTQYWFHWIDDVDVCRSQIAGDISEWTFFTGDGAPKATYNTIALSAAPYPGVARKLGLPNPTNALSVSLGPYAPADTAAIVYLYPSQIDQITAGANAIEYSIDNEQTFTGINITSGNETVAGVVAAITALTPPSGISAVVETFDQNEVLQAVKVTSTATGASANLTIRIEIANAPDKTSAFSYSGYDSGAKTGSSNTISSYLITDTEIGSAEIGHQMDLSVKINTSSTFCNTVILNTGANTAADLAKSFMFGQIILDATEITAFIAGQYLQFGQGVTLVSTVTSVGGYTADTLATAINSGRVDPGSGFVIFAGAFDGKVYINAIAPAISEISWTRYSGDPADPGTTTENSGLSSKMPESGGNPYVDVVAYGSIIFVTPNSIGTGSTDETTYARYNAPAGTPNRAALTQAFIANSEAASPAKVIINQDDIDAVEGSFVSILTNDGENIVLVPNPSTVNSLFGLVGGSVNINIYGNASPVAVITSVATGVLATLRIQEGSYASTVNDYITIKAGGGTEEPSATESRSYVFTWVNKESGFEFESGPSPASEIVDVHVGQDVTISGFSTIASGYAATNLRIYRTVSGVFLFVDELLVSQTSYTDTKIADELAEELPSITWSPPPVDLKGLINLPNGMMAGFVGRDVYFCEAYRPHAWPLNYVQTMDFPVVGLGRMDTTLAVLTTGTPYFIQGSSPDSTVVVKSDLEQACVSKRSIVSTNGVVVYASPDGLIMLTPGGSQMVTEKYFNRAQWQTYFQPTSIHAYSHDMKYIAFYEIENGDGTTTQGGFIYDFKSQQFILHNLYASAGYADLQQDQLFVVTNNRLLKKWEQGSALSYIWKSKKFTMPYPIGFTCAQVEAETYPVTCKIYQAGTLIHTQTVASREPFRLPSNVGRDWEIQLEGTSEVFSLDLAQSMGELGGV
jgi:hypothetical protein